MPEEHIIMTISVPGRAVRPSPTGDTMWPLEHHTFEEVVQTDGLTARQVYQKALDRTVEDYSTQQMRFGQTVLDNPAVLLYDRQLYQPPNFGGSLLQDEGVVK